MEFFKYLLFGVAGLSLIFWVCVIALWHTYMFPRCFGEEQHSSNINNLLQSSPEGIISESGLIDRAKYSNKSFVIADFNKITTSEQQFARFYNNSQHLRTICSILQQFTTFYNILQQIR